MSSGYLSVCKSCIKLRNQSRKHQINETTRKWYHSGGKETISKDKNKRALSKYRAKNKDKILCHQAVRIAIRNGSLKRLPCAVCGSIKSHAHHEDYSKPLEVVWLCPFHHAQRHIELHNGEQGLGSSLEFDLKF